MSSFDHAIFSLNSRFESDHLTIGGVSAVALAEQFGTPLFVLDEADFFTRAASWKSALEEAFGPHAGTVYYAAKSFISKEVARWVNKIGIGLDVCTGGELAVAQAVDFPAARIELHGNNKSEAEIQRGIECGVGTIVIDSFVEIERTAKIAQELNKVQKVYIRVTPGVEAHTHEFISTAHEDVKFGFSLASGAAWQAIELIKKHPSLQLSGLHSHIGSQIFNSDGFAAAAKKLIQLLAQYRDTFNTELPELDLGGGYGIAYIPGEVTLDPYLVMKELAEVVTSECAAVNIAIPRISIEPGRAIVGPTTTTLYTVGTTKEVELDNGHVRRYVAVDGGMSENIRPALYGAEYFAIIANRSSGAEQVNTRVVGKHCESGDIIIREIELSKDLAPGDLLAVPATGAYGRSMASNYNHLPRPAVVAVIDGKARIIVRRESEADLLALEL
ncbi:MAG: diaminopimelate decarboxylase [Actinomycetota bacterium]